MMISIFLCIIGLAFAHEFFFKDFVETLDLSKEKQ